jgi:putative FmdB family regulatory protein
MPTYDYKCLDCGHRFEAFQSMTDEPLTACDECGGQVKRLIGSGAGIIFKGSGFYETDYKKKSGSPTASASSTNDESKEAKSAETSAAKPAEKTESTKKPAETAA